MISLCRSRSTSLLLGLAMACLVCSHTAVLAAENVRSAPIQTSASLPPEPPAPQVSYLYAMSPEAQGDLFMAHRSYVAAIEAYQHGTLKSAILWNKIGLAYHHLFALDEARKDYEMALSLNPRYPDALNNLAAVYHGKHDYKQAERTYKRALKYAPRAAVTYCNLGTAYFAEKKYKQGFKAYQQALAIDPEVFNPEQASIIEEGSSRQQRIAVNYFLAKTYATAGEKVKALTYLRKALDAGFNDRKRLMEDKEFAVLRTTPEFHQLLLEQQWLGQS